MSGAAYLLLEGLSKSFGAASVLTDLSIGIEKGEIFALLGPSGSGKTTALRLLAGFETPDAGRIRVAGEEVTRLPPAQRRFGMVFQHYALFPHLSVGGNVAFGLTGDKASVASRVRTALERVEMGGFEDRPVTAISGGQQQRVAVARALAPEPRVLLLDEPLSNLDPTLRERTRRALAKLVRQVGITTVLVTHEQEEAFELGDRVGVLHQGRLQQVGTPEELYQRPANRFVAGFIGRASFLPGTLTHAGGSAAVALDGLLDAAGAPVAWRGELAGELSAGAAVELAVRPEALALVEAGRAGAVEGTVADRRYAGPLTYTTVALPTGVEIEVLTPGAAACRPGDRVWVAASGTGPLPRIFPRAAR